MANQFRLRCRYTSAGMHCRRIALHGTSDPANVALVAGAIRRGELVVLPTETVYGLAARPSDPAQAGAVRALKGRSTAPFTWHVAERSELERLCGVVPERIRRLVDRYWPGPLTVVVPTVAGEEIGIRLPAHRFTCDVIRAVGEPLWMTSVNRSGNPPLCDADSIEREFGSSISVLCDDGPSPIGSASTVVRLRGTRLEVLREGILTRDEVLRTAAHSVLFVCTGNTCRSPLAEAMARRAVALRLGVADEEVLAHGLHFASVGTGGFGGMPASEGSTAAAAEVGLDLSRHRSTSFETADALRASQVLCLSTGHLRAVAAVAPGLGERVQLLDPAGRDVRDPYGGTLAEYRQMREQVAAAVERRLEEWLRWVR